MLHLQVILKIIRNILHKFKTELLDNGSIFTSEADFKYNLALKLSKEPEISNIVIEFPEKISMSIYIVNIIRSDIILN